jgi:hypothetical protein
MKALIFILIALISASYTQAQLAASLPHQWKMTLIVTNEMGQPVAGADAHVGNSAANQNNGLTDSNGVFIASGIDKSYALGLFVSKSNYYQFSQRYELGWAYNYNKSKWNPTIHVALKRMIKPIPMYAKRIDMDPPTNNQPVGYDLMVGDWVGPYGKGVTTDILFTREFNRKSLQDYDCKLLVSFPKDGDGIQEIPVPYKKTEGSTLRAPYGVPTNGYLAQITRLNISHPDQKLVFEYDENRVYFFRVRTVLDDEGHVVSAHYGKIYGDFMQFSYYLNPTPNDRNVEFDPKQNLIQGLRSSEQVSQP